MSGEGPSSIGGYEIIRLLGKGGMGTVYLGRDPKLNRPVAIKVLRAEVHDEDLLERFLREARAAAALRHPNIITIYATGQHDRQPFIVMEFVDGESLADVIRYRRQLTLADRLSYLEQICAGLAFAHRSGIVHRDVKPANLMVDREGIVRVLDFGIARVDSLAALTNDGAMIGTLNYMSPEQMLGRAVDHRSDIFSVGAVAYELLSYERAFKGSVGDGLLTRVQHDDPPGFHELGVDLPPGLDEIVIKALEKTPDDRFQDLAEMQAALADVRRGFERDAALETLVAGSATTARTSDAPPFTGEWRGRGNIEHATRAGWRRYAVWFGGAAAIAATAAVVQLSPRGPEMPAPATPGAIEIDAGRAVETLPSAALVSLETPAESAAGPPLPETVAGAQPENESLSGDSATPMHAAAEGELGREAASGPRSPDAVRASRVEPSAGAPATAASAAVPGTDPRVQDLVARVSAMYTGGDLPGALDWLGRHPDLATDARVSEWASRVAGAAVDAMISAERTALSGNAATLAQEPLARGNSAKARAGALAERSDFVGAGQQALEARDAFQAAGAAALASAARPASAPASPAAPAAVSSPPAAPPAPAPADMEGVFAALGRFQAAYRDRDIDAVIRAFPSIRREPRQRMEGSFRACRGADVSFADEQIRFDSPVSPTSASVTLRSVYSCTPRTGQSPQLAESREVFLLVKKGGIWIIEDTGTIH